MIMVMVVVVVVAAVFKGIQYYYHVVSSNPITSHPTPSHLISSRHRWNPTLDVPPTRNTASKEEVSQAASEPQLPRPRM